jgi:excisionase family DNA binding protein
MAGDQAKIGSRKAARLLGVDKSTLTRWIVKGKIPAEKLDGDGAYMLDLADVLDLAVEKDEADDERVS